MQQELARKRHWTLADIPWQGFDPSKVDAEILKVVKAAAMVEHNGGDYGTYLCNVFHDDPEFQAVARNWAAEEVQHGAALAEWAETDINPNFDHPGVLHGTQAAAAGIADLETAMGRDALHRALGGRPPLDPATAPGEQSPVRGVRLPTSLNTRLDEVAAAQGRRPSDLIREALARYLAEAS